MNGLKKNLRSFSVSQRKAMIALNSQGPTIMTQCQALALPRSTFYYQRLSISMEEQALMNGIDQIFTQCPFYGSRKIMIQLRAKGFDVGRNRVRTLMKQMGLEAIYPKQNLSRPHPGHKIYPYLLRGQAITGPNQVWSTDITYIRLVKGFMYLVAIIDWFSRYVLSWRISNSLDADFCIEALEDALSQGQPNIFNTDQGSQFTSEAFTGVLLAHDIQISMDGRGRALDNVFVERLWRSVKYEDIYIKGYETAPQLHEGLGSYFPFYNTERPHQSLEYRTPYEIHYGTGALLCANG